MNKYIQDTIRNNLRSLNYDLSIPQKKALYEIMRGIFTAGRPILRHMAQNEEIGAKRQADKYSHHLGQIDLEEKVERFVLKKAIKTVKKNTIIAYDLTDIAKGNARCMEKIRRVFDGSKRKVTNGYILHGVGINKYLVKLRVHNGDKYTQNQIRREVIKEVAKKTHKKGIYVFDRQNDDKRFFVFLASKTKVDFVVRLKENRQVVIKKTGLIASVKDLKLGKYRIYLLEKNNRKIDKEREYVLVINKHLKDKEPIRLITNLAYGKHSKNKITTLYLERWGVENIFRRTKTKFELEKIRVLNYRKFVNLVALIQFAVLISTQMYLVLQKNTNALITGVLQLYKHFLKIKSLSMNVDSFISFLKDSLSPFVFRDRSPPNQLPLIPYRHLKKLVPF